MAEPASPLQAASTWPESHGANGTDVPSGRMLPARLANFGFEVIARGHDLPHKALFPQAIRPPAAGRQRPLSLKRPTKRFRIHWSAGSDSKRRLQCIDTVKVLRGSSAGSSA